MVNKEKRKRRLRKAYARRRKEIVRQQELVEIAKTNEALYNILEKRGFFK